MSDELPEHVVHIDVLRITRGIEKRCKCKAPRSFIVDDNNSCVNCGTCGAWVDSFEAISELAEHYERVNQQLDALYEQRKQISQYKPHLLVIREIERRYRGKEMLPTCPHCKRGFYIEEINGWVNRRVEEHRRFEERHSVKPEVKE